MRTITPVKIWKDGSLLDAVTLDARILDATKSSATVYYTLYTADNIIVGEGQRIMTGEDYDNWVDNDYAYTWLSKQINLKLAS